MGIIGLLISFAISFGLFIIAMSVHELAHGYVAYRLGDMTAKNAGRLTLNPLAHIDPVWTVFLPLLLFLTSGGQFIFGAAKPIPISYWALKNPKKDMIWIGASGPLANFILAFLLTIPVKLLPLSTILQFILVNLIVINIALGVFNLMPIPPLDGSRILTGLLPKELALHYSNIEPYGFIILLLFVWFGFLSRIVWPIVELILRLLGISS